MDFAQHVKSSVDIVHVVGDHVRLKKQGARWVGLCPFHSEKTPSFTVNPGLQIFKCFGCGKGGDVFNFLMEVQGLTFYEALTALAEQHGIPIPERRSDHQTDAETQLREAVARMHETAQAFFREQLRGPKAQQAREYLTRRGIDPETAERFGIGYAPPGSQLASVLERKGYSREHITQSGLVGEADDRPGFYDRFRDRVTFPIADTAGRVIAFGARALRDDQQPKYLNSPETALYKKSSVLYNLHRAKEGMRHENHVILVEGYMDVIGVAKAGVSEAVASCGTALTPQQVRLMRRLVDTVIVNFDADSAGQSATEKSVNELLKEGFQVRILELPGGLDPDEYCTQHGGEAYRKRLASAESYFTWLADRARKRFDMRSAEGRVAAFEFLRPSINLLSDKIMRATLAGEIAEHMGVDKGLILDEFRRAATERSRAPMPHLPQHPLGPSERLLLELFLDSVDARTEMLAEAAAFAREEKLSSEAIFTALEASVADGQPFVFSAFEGRLGERDRDIVSKIVFDRDRREVSIDEGRQALVAMERQCWERAYRSVRRGIVDAEKAGDRNQTLQLLVKKLELEKKLGMNVRGGVR